MRIAKDSPLLTERPEELNPIAAGGVDVIKVFFLPNMPGGQLCCYLIDSPRAEAAAEGEQADLIGTHPQLFSCAVPIGAKDLRAHRVAGDDRFVGRAELFHGIRHGGKDQGTNSQDILEKDVNLSVARLLAKNLEKAGAQVIMTRTADTYIGLEERAQLANDAKADLFISVHCNYCEDDASVQGLECYYSKDSTGGQILAETIDQTVSRGARTADYRVLLRTEMPAVLIELGYFSNSSECRKLATSEYQSLLAENIAEAVMNEQTIAAAVTDTPQ